jgi:hypothetical protein
MRFGMRGWTRVTVACAVAGLVAGCASSTGGGTGVAATPTSPPPRATDLAHLVRGVPCAPKKPEPVTRAQLRAFPAVAAVTCGWGTRTYPHAGEWSVMIRKASDSGIAALVAAFDQPNEPPSTTGCLDVLIGGPPLVLVDAHGGYVLAHYPQDGCSQPLGEAIDAMRHHAWRTISVHRDKLIRSARSLATGCADDIKDMLYYEPGTTLSSGQAVLNRHPQLPLKACIYAAAPSLEVGHFVRKVDFDAAASAALRDALSNPGPARSCVPQRRFALVRTPIYDKAGDADTAWVELGGCWRVYFDEWPVHDRNWRSLVGTADPAAVARLLRRK